MKRFLPPLSSCILLLVSAQGKPSLETFLDSTQTNNPFGVAFDRKGNIYVAEYMGGRILLITNSGKISVFFGKRRKRVSRGRTGSRQSRLQWNTQYTPWIQRRSLYLGYPQQPDPED
jgi:DNA-binding beta-propeller fold protein YncE